jgi:hypothetical protein
MAPRQPTSIIILFLLIAAAAAVVALGLRPPLAMQAWATAVAWDRRRRAFLAAAEYLRVAASAHR